MSSNKEISKFVYDTKDFNFIVNSREENASSFDEVLRDVWKRAEEMKAFHYNLNIRKSKILQGKYRFLAQLNPDRPEHRHVPESDTSVTQSFNPLDFNMTKEQEVLYDMGNGINDIIAINARPLEENHCLVLTEYLKHLPQVMTEDSLRQVLELYLSSNLWYLRAAFNGYAYAPVNQLHWHLYYLKHEMLLEYIDVCSYIYDVHLLVDYPAKGFCLKLSDFKAIEEFVSRTMLVVCYFQKYKKPHNVYITPAKSKYNDELYNDIRIYIWIRKPLIDVKDLTALTSEACELFGHLSIKDENVYNNLTEDDVINDLYNITEEYFLLIKDELKSYLGIYDNIKHLDGMSLRFIRNCMIKTVKIDDNAKRNKHDKN